MGRGASYRTVLAVPDARRLIGASAASQLGDWLYNAALLAYVYSATGSAAWVGAATIARLLPYVVLGPLGGAVADRYAQRTVLLVGDVLRLLVMLALAAVVAADAPVVAVIALTVLASAAGSAEKPAAMAMLPRLVPEQRLGTANALLHTVQGLGIVLGPALGALLLATTPDWGPFVANAATFAVSGAVIAGIRHRAVPSAPSAGAAAQVGEGLRTIRTAPHLAAIMVAVAVVELTYGAQTVQLVVYARDSLGLGEGGYGLLLAGIGVGGLLSTLVSGRLASGRRVVAAIVVTSAGAGAVQLAFAATDAAALAFAIAVLAGAAFVTCEVVAETVMVGLVPADRLGRVMGVFDAVGVAATVAGALLAPLLVESTSLRTSLVVLGAVAVVVALSTRIGLGGLDAMRGRRLDALGARMRVLTGMPMTTGVSPAVLEQLAAAAHECPLPAGVDVVVEGAPAHAYYAVIAGSVIVHRDGEELRTLGPGEGFGERGLLDAAPRNATVTTGADTTLLRIEGRVLLDALSAAPGLRSALDRSNRPAGGGDQAMQETAFVDDPRWVPA